MYVEHPNGNVAEYGGGNARTVEASQSHVDIDDVSNELHGQTDQDRC